MESCTATQDHIGVEAKEEWLGIVEEVQYLTERGIATKQQQEALDHSQADLEDAEKEVEEERRISIRECVEHLEAEV